MARKTMRRDDWRRVLEKDVLIEDYSWNGLPGKISLLTIRRVSGPLTVGYGDMRVKIVEAGYSWLQIALEGRFAWLTSMFDERGKLLQIYIDMTDGNVTAADDPYFDDMYLDYVVSGDRIRELDRDELDEAFRAGAISRAQYERTLSEGAKLTAWLRENTGVLAETLAREYRRLKRRTEAPDPSAALRLHAPTYEELWFRQKMLADEATMSYNHAWGGVIDFSEDRWAAWHDRWVLCPEGKRFYRYLQADGGEFVGEIAYHLDEALGACLADVIVYAPYRGRGFGGAGLRLLCEAAKANGLSCLYDDIALDNPAVGLFLRHGFAEQYRTDGIIMLKKDL